MIDSSIIRTHQHAAGAEKAWSSSNRAFPWRIVDKAACRCRRQRVADRGYDSDVIIVLIEEQGSAPVIPPRSHRHAARSFDKMVYTQRHKIEFFFNRIKHYRRAATRYEKTARNDLAMIQIACIRLRSAF